MHSMSISDIKELYWAYTWSEDWCYEKPHLIDCVIRLKDKVNGFLLEIEVNAKFAQGFQALYRHADETLEKLKLQPRQLQLDLNEAFDTKNRDKYDELEKNHKLLWREFYREMEKYIDFLPPFLDYFDFMKHIKANEDGKFLLFFIVDLKCYAELWKLDPLLGNLERTWAKMKRPAGITKIINDETEFQMIGQMQIDEFRKGL